MRSSFLLSWRRVLAVGVALTAVGVPSPAEALKVTVKGTAVLEGQVQTDGEAQVIKGRLRDDLGAPVPSARIQVDVLQPDGKPLLTLPTPLPCGGPGPSPRQTPDAYQLDTDGQGAFCARTQKLPQRGTLRMRFAGKSGLGPVAFEIPFDAERPSPQLAWDPRPEQIDLDTAQARVAVALTGGGSESLGVELLDEAGKVLATATTDERGRAIFEVATATLGGPGAGELVVRPRKPGPDVQPLRGKVLRVARVGLVSSPPPQPIVPHDGYRFQVAAETQRGAVTGGVVEAKIGPETVGVGSVRAGRADVVTTFDVPAEGALDITFRYLPAAPELRAGEGLVLRVPVRPPSPLRKAPLLLAALLLVGWLARGWRRPARAERPARPGADAGGAKVALPPLVAEPEAGAQGWRGVVLDAHEHEPVEGARVRVVARDFYGERDVASAQVKHDGSFKLEGAWEPARFLVVDAPWHVSMERPLPKPGRLSLALVSRKRALLERLLVAAKKLGLGGAVGIDPTPAQVAQGFEGQQRPGGARWAREVETAVFGGQQVGSEEEARVAALEEDLARREGPEWVRR